MSHKQVEVWSWIFVCGWTCTEVINLHSHLSGCGQTCPGMLKVMSNSESASSQEWVEAWSCIFAYG